MELFILMPQLRREGNVSGLERTEKLKDEAQARHDLHKDQASHRPLSKGYEYVGLRGEDEFAERLGTSLDWTRRPGGDKGVDFVIADITIDVKTARKAYNLIVEKGKVWADIYVLAGYSDEDDSVFFWGWELGHNMLRRPLKRFHEDGPLNHYLPRTGLKSMGDLWAFLADEQKNTQLAQ